MKKITHILKAAPRQLVLRLLARFHCGLVAGILFAVAFSSISLLGISYASPESAFWRGILFALPSALCFYAAKRLPVMWQFLLASALLCGLSWILIGHPGGPVLTALMALFRAKTGCRRRKEGLRCAPSSTHPPTGYCWSFWGPFCSVREWLSPLYSASPFWARPSTFCSA
ncbi:hypothetical protein D7X94_08445 [Acutalibacter sp. 1XD8-33]|nr:hypothetical protein D7X94_08445 [Acutalibacter sp. 1XD8-33]